MGANPHANGGLLLRDLRHAGFSRLRGDGAEARRHRRPRRRACMGTFLRDVMKLNAATAQLPRCSGRTRPPRIVWMRVFEVTDRMSAAEILPTTITCRAGRPRDGSAQRAHVPGLARRLSADRPSRILLLLRSVHSHRRLDVQPAREVAEDPQSHSVAPADRVAELPADLARLASGSQRLQPPGSRLHRSRRQQEGGDRARLSAAGCEHAAVGRRSLPAQPQLRERDRRRQAARAAVAGDGCGDQALQRRRRHLGLGEQRSRTRAGRGDGVRRRRADARNAGGRRHAARARCRS